MITIIQFKDCHARNFVLTPDMKTVMIDTEQMRKDAKELLCNPDTWVQRDQHQNSGLRKLPGLIELIVDATKPAGSKVSILRQRKASLEEVQLAEALTSLGRTRGSVEVAMQASVDLVKDLVAKGYLRSLAKGLSRPS